MAQAQILAENLMHCVEICVDKELSLTIHRDKVTLKLKRKGSRPIVLSIAQWYSIKKVMDKVECALDLVNC